MSKQTTEERLIELSAEYAKELASSDCPQVFQKVSACATQGAIKYAMGETATSRKPDGRLNASAELLGVNVRTLTKRI